MANVRIAAIAFTFLSAILVAQPAPTVHFTVKVTDQTGAVFPGAQIGIDASHHETKRALTTNAQGEAVLDLAPGHYTVSIVAPGFERWEREVEVENPTSQTISAELIVQPTIDDFTIVDISDLGLTPTHPVLITLISFQPFQNLASLPAIKAPRPGLFHRHLSKLKPSQTS